MIKFLISFLFTLLLPGICHAFFCPNNFNQIQIGDSMDQVTKACGPPNSQSESTEADDSGPQQWSFYMPQHGITGPSVNPQGSMQAVFSFDGSGKIINIMVNNVSVGSTNVCGGSIQLGASRESVKTACGNPMYINKPTQSADQSATPTSEVKMIQFNYNGNPPVSLIFQNGILKDRR